MTVMAAEAGAGAGAAGAESGAAAAAGGASKKTAAAKTPPKEPAEQGGKQSEAPAKKSGGGKESAAAGASGGRVRRSARWAWSDNRKVLIAEFLICVVVLGLGTVVSPDDSKHDVPRAMIKGSALAGVFFLLTLVSTAGGNARRTANAIGTLITASYVLTSADVHNIVSWAAGFFQAPEAGAAAGAGLVGGEQSGATGGGEQA